MDFKGSFISGTADCLADVETLTRYDKLAREIAGFEPSDLLKVLGFDNEAGYNQYADRIVQTTDGADMNAMWREFQASIAILNRQREPLVRLLSYLSTDIVERLFYPTDHDFEEASEFGVPRGMRLGAPFSLGFDFKWYDLAIRYTWMFLADASQDQVRALNSSALEASVRLQFNKVLKAIFNNVDRTSTNPNNNVAINVYPFYNADGMVPPSYKGTSFVGSHTHYFSSGGATVTPSNIQTLETDLYSHGYRNVEGYTLLLLVNRAEGLVIRTFRAGTASALYDFIPGTNVGGGVYLPANSGIVGAPPATQPAGLTSIGTYGPFTIVEEDYIPSGWMVALASGGEFNLGNPVGIREHQRADLRGLQLVKGADDDYPLTESYYRQGLGTGIRQRGGGAVMKITAGAYSIPTAYA